MKRLVWIALAQLAASAVATTKGLNQIVTPDIQPFGQFSISFQAQHSTIGNPYQFQYEYGFDPKFEAAVFQGLDPGAQYLATEYGIVQKPDVLLSVGFLNWSTRGDAPQPFIEGGWNKGNLRVIGGLQRVGRANIGIVGAAYQTNSKLLVQADYLGGNGNFTTFGFTYSPTPNLSVNPALYMDNTSAHKLFPYLVVSWSITLVKPKK